MDIFEISVAIYIDRYLYIRCYIVNNENLRAGTHSVVIPSQYVYSDRLETDLVRHYLVHILL